MPLSFGTPSQVSLFRHIADPKQVSQDKLRELKVKASKKNKTRESVASYGRSGGRQSVVSSQLGKSLAPKSTFGASSRAARSHAHGLRNESRDEEQDNYHEQERTHDHEDDDEHAPRQNTDRDDDEVPKFEEEVESPSYEAEKSQVQTLIDQEVDREKEHFLAELRKYRGQTSREFTMQDSLTDIQFEYDRLKSPENAANVVRIMGIVLQVVVYAVQWGNNKFGPLLKLDNGDTSWAMQTAESISNRDYDNVLEKLYRKHWRKGSMSPEAELGMMLVGSAGVFHFQTHVNEKLTRRSSSGREGGSKSGGGGFNLMDLVGPVMGLMGGGGSKSLPNNNDVPFSFMMGSQGGSQGGFVSTGPPPAKFDFVAGRSQSQAPPPPPASAPAAAFAAPPPPSNKLVEMEQQFARRQQEMLNRMDEVTRRADEQMRASQARQLDLERQLQQTQLKLHQVSQQSMQQQQFHAFHQQQQMDMRQRQMQAHQQHQQQPQVQPNKFAQQQRPQPFRGHNPELTIVEEQSPSPPASPVLGLDDSEASGEEQEPETKFDVKEVMVTEKLKRKKNPVELEIDELSIAL